MTKKTIIYISLICFLMQALGNTHICNAAPIYPIPTDHAALTNSAADLLGLEVNLNDPFQFDFIINTPKNNTFQSQIA